MLTIEQAIFTSAKTDRAVGYQVIAHSPGVHQIDVRELAVWCPSHDSLLDQDSDAVSFNFHPLPSGAYCVSRTVPAGCEYSGRGGARVYTHCLIVAAEVLARFANNPFAILQAAWTTRAMDIRDPIPTRLEPLPLTGGTTLVDQSLLIWLGNRLGPRKMAGLVQSALDSVCLAVTGDPSPGELFAGLMYCLPLACRLDLSFSTGLKFSGRRPFHLIALSKDPSERRWIEHQNNVTVLDLAESKPLPSIPMDGWARFIQQVFSSGQISFLTAELSKRRFDLKPEDLPALGLQLIEDLETSTFSNSAEITAPKAIQQAHAAHHQFQKTRSQSQNQVAHLTVEAPSACMHTDSPEVLAKLELLDDLVYDAINGTAGALDQLQTVWPTIRTELGDDLLIESREQYLRYALRIWEGCVDNDEIRNPTQAVQALDVLCLLFDE